ncbi:putative inactive poly [ADP-ribose] polymerase SRO3 [Bienertia sinuspersici]
MVGGHRRLNSSELDTRLFEMSANEDIGASTGMGSTEHLDLGRKYGLPNPSNKVNWTCNFCKKVCKGGVYRLKQHLVGALRNVTKCPTCPEHVWEEVKVFMIKKAEAKNVNQMMPSVDDTDDYNDVEELK